MASEADNENRSRLLPTLSENNYPEWRRRVVMLLKHKKLYQHCVDERLPSVNSDSRPSAADYKIIDANAETCNLIAGTLDSNTFTEIFDDDETMENAHLLWNKLTKRFASSTFNNQARIWMRFCRITYNSSLRSFISEIRQCLNEVISVQVEVGTPTLAFTILTNYRRIITT
ncbi:hypothetical protein O181_034927 [Austropuccinia psidii MF-1]|uniref:Uncharacterized protein n=1 Tax=Austropuccinia psidii MF-1 TaxID=1389203 RepID=A0A9Q3D7M5_9BASI|nr:hypothetical protein [Austropuccinia psidii MF-1]